MVRSGGEIDSSVKDDLAPRRRRRVRIWHVAVALLLCCAAVVLSLRWHWRHEFQKRIEAIRAAGYPATPQELEAWYKYPQSGENAAHWVMDAGALYVEPSKDDWEQLLPIVFKTRHSEPTDSARPLDPNLMRLLERHIQANSAALKSLYDGAAIEECRYPTDLSKGIDAMTMHVTAVREGVSLLCLEAVLHAERGDPNRAVEAIKTAVRIAGTPSDEPLMISHMVATFGANTAAVALERVLNRVELTDAQLKMLALSFQDFNDHAGLLRALVGMRCDVYSIFNEPEAMNRAALGKLPPKAVLEIYNALGLAARDGAAYLDCLQECIDALQGPVSQYRAAGEAAEVRRLRGGKGILSSQLSQMTSGTRVMSYEAASVAPREMARVLLAVERYRMAHGALPDGLDSLVPQYLAAVPEDPHDGAPLRYKRSDRGYVVYSVDGDGRDDGGKQTPPKDARKSNETWDFVFRVQR
jgi:hypothetical protein